MNLSDLTMANLNKAGKTIHLQFDGRPIYLSGLDVTMDETDKPCLIKLAGIGDPKITDLVAQFSRAQSVHAELTRRAGSAELEKEFIRHESHMEDLLKRLFGIAVVGWENISIPDGSGRSKIATESDRAEVLRAVGVKTAFMDQLLKGVTEQARDFTLAAKV